MTNSTFLLDNSVFCFDGIPDVNAPNFGQDCPHHKTDSTGYLFKGEK